MFNPYEHMKAKRKKNFNETVHWNYLFNTRLSMFDVWFDNKEMTDTLRPELIHSLMATQGTCGITEYKGKLYTGPGGYTGEVVNFVPTEYLITVPGIGATELRGKVGETFAVGWNNATATPDLALLQFASILTEIDVSERVNVQFTRFLRIPYVSDSKEKKEIEEAIAAIMDGRFMKTVSRNSVKKLLGDEQAAEQFLDLVDIKEVDKLQYLNQYRDNIVKRIFQMYGQGMQSTAKLAQQTTDELHGNDNVSMILPLNMLKKGQEFRDEVNRLWDVGMHWEFSEAWMESREEMHKEIGETHDDGHLEGEEGDTHEETEDVSGS